MIISNEVWNVASNTLEYVVVTRTPNTSEYVAGFWFTGFFGVFFPGCMIYGVRWVLEHIGVKR